MISPCVTPGQWTHLCIRGADGLAVHRFRALSRLARGGGALHTGNQLPPEPPDVGTRRRLPLRDSVHLPGDAAPRQPRRDPHQRPAFYPAMLDAIRGATHSVIMELYIFQPGKIADQFVAALSDRARHGVNVTIVVDAIGSLSLRGRPVRRLRKAGCRIESYQQLRWYSLARLNNRTHRELLIVDGRVAFAGGAGIADWWAIGRQAPAALARYDGADRGAGRRRAAGRGRRELAGVLRRDPDRPGIFSRARRERRDDGVRGEELTVRPCHDLARGRFSC